MTLVVSRDSSDKGPGVLCVSWCLQQHHHCSPATVRATEQHSVGPTSTPPHGPCLVCFIQTLYTLPTHTHASRMFWALKMRKNSNREHLKLRHCGCAARLQWARPSAAHLRLQVRQECKNDGPLAKCAPRKRLLGRRFKNKIK